ncbi:DUF2612 domain-containing protein [Acetobacteraceae bacterium]|nr:DUF2612 domain-containing protein [Acetobacteraceae bacterium]
MQNLHETFLAQYANSPRITGILKRFNKAADPAELIEIFLTQVLDPLTATGWGLDVWGRIVGVSRVLKIPVEDSFFGFSEALSGGATGITGFQQSRFYSSEGSALTQNYALTDEAFRKLIFAKAAANITNGTLQSLNQILMRLFSDSSEKNIWIEEGNTQRGSFFGFSEASPDSSVFGENVFQSPAFSGILNMHMLICYNWVPSSLELTLIAQACKFIRPSGVSLSTQYVVPPLRSPSLPPDALWNPDTGYLLTQDQNYLIP